MTDMLDFGKGDGLVAYHDPRDDFDDEFSRSKTPQEVVRRRVFLLGVVFLVIGIIGVLWTATMAVAAVAWMSVSAPFEVGIYFCLALLGCLFVLVIVGGWCLMRLRRYGVAFTAAYCLACLSLFGVYALPFFPFGIWGLILLYQPDVREEFRRIARVED
jgi:hypothetical protein